jgi:hypothetical protein
MSKTTGILAVALAFALGCGGEAKKPGDGKVLDCSVVPRAVDRIMGDKAGDPTVITMGPKIKDAMFARCTNDTWKQEALQCIDKAKNRTEMDTCRGHLSKDQQKRVQDDVRAVQAALAPAEPAGSGSAAAGSGSAAAGSGSAAGSAAPAEAGSGK